MFIGIMGETYNRVSADIDTYWNKAKEQFAKLPSKHDWPIVTGCADSLWAYGNWERNIYYDF